MAVRRRALDFSEKPSETFNLKYEIADDSTSKPDAHNTGPDTRYTYVLPSDRMRFRELLTRKKIIIASAVLALGIVAAAYFALRRPQRVHMERYVPATALAFIEVDNLPDLIDGLTDTRAWREIAPALGLSSQLKQLGFTSDLIGRTGVGPDEAVVAARAQYIISLTGVDAETGATDEGPYIHFKPRFALVIETQAAPETAARLVRERASIIAQRIYGDSAIEDSEAYQENSLLIFHGPQPDRQLVAAASGSVIVIANHAAPVKSCLDVINGREASLAADETLQRMRPTIDHDAPIFAFVTESGVSKLVELGPALIASRFPVEPETIGSVAGLFEHLSKQAAAGLLYSSEFASGGVVEKYLTALKPLVGEGLAESMKPAPGASFPSLQLVPNDVKDFTILNVDRAGELPERALKSLSPRIDVVATLALKQLVLNFRKQYGLGPSDDVGDAVGNEVTLASFDDGDPMAMIVSVKDKARLTPIVARYLQDEGAKLTSDSYAGIEINISSNEDGRAAAFIGSYLVFGTRDQIRKMIDTQAGGTGISNDERLKDAIANRSASASIISYRPETSDAGELMLAISKLTRVTDGSRELLEQDDVRAALGRVPPKVSFTEFRGSGIYTETRSAVGNFSLVASLIGGEAQGQE